MLKLPSRIQRDERARGKNRVRVGNVSIVEGDRSVIDLDVFVIEPEQWTGNQGRQQTQRNRLFHGHLCTLRRLALSRLGLLRLRVLEQTIYGPGQLVRRDHKPLFLRAAFSALPGWFDSLLRHVVHFLLFRSITVRGRHREVPAPGLEPGRQLSLARSCKPRTATAFVTRGPHSKQDVAAGPGQGFPAATSSGPSCAALSLFSLFLLSVACLRVGAKRDHHCVKKVAVALRQVRRVLNVRASDAGNRHPNG